MALAPRSHEVPPPQLTRLLAWLTGGRPAAGDGLPGWLPALAAACEPLEDAPANQPQPGCVCSLGMHPVHSILILVAPLPGLSNAHRCRRTWLSTNTKLYASIPTHGHTMYAIIKLGCTAVFRYSASLSQGVST